MIVDGYLRVSQVGERSGESFISPRDQREQIEQWAERRGVLVGEVFEELDESGGRRDRPLLEQAISRVEQGHSHGVVVAYMSRFGRSQLDGLIAIDRITRAGGAFISVQEGLDFSTDIGRHMLRSMLSWAEWELDRTRANWDKARARAVARGAWMSSRPFGYRKGRQGRLVRDPREGPIVVELFRRRGDGASIAELRRFLAAAEVKTTRGREWTSSGVGKLLGYRTYLGEMRHGEFVNAAAHAALVDELTWQGAQRHNRPVPDPRGQRTPALLRGILRCAGCQRPLQTAVAQNVSSYATRWYFCRDVQSSSPCPEPACVSDAAAEPYIEELLFQELARPRRTAAAKRVVALEAEVTKRERELIAYRDHPSLVTAIGPSRFSDGLAVRTRRLESKQVELWRAKLDAQEPGSPDPTRLRERWPSMTITERRVMIAQVLECAFLSRGRNIEERLFVCLRGRAPADLPLCNPLRPFESRRFDPSSCPPGVWLRSREDWTEGRLRDELSAFLDGRDRWPTFADFQHAGRALLYAEVQRRGGPRCVSAALGLPFAPPRRDRYTTWSEQRIRDELTSYLAGRSRWPTCKQFKTDGQGALRSAIRSFGGAERWARELGVECDRVNLARPKWSYFRMKEELAAFTRDRDDWPPVAEFEAAGRLTLYHAIGRSGTRSRLAADLDLELPPGRIRIRTPTRWTDDAIAAALDQLLEGRASWPGSDDFQQARLGGLYTVLLRPGVREMWARRYGMTPPRRRNRMPT